jgi:hypothetical protein
MCSYYLQSKQQEHSGSSHEQHSDDASGGSKGLESGEKASCGYVSNGRLSGSSKRASSNPRLGKTSSRQSYRKVKNKIAMRECESPSLIDPIGISTNLHQSLP